LPGDAGFIGWHSQHSRQTGGNGAIGCRFRFGRHVNCEAVSIGRTNERRILADGQVVVRVRVTIAATVCRDDRPNESAADSACSVGQIARLIVPPNLANGKGGDCGKEAGQRFAAFGCCNFLPMKGKRSGFCIATIT